MNLSFAPSWFRPILAALIALAFIAAPMADKAHAAEADDTCFVDDVVSDTASKAPADRTPPAEHDHPAHHCGACHHPVWRTSGAQPLGLGVIGTDFPILSDNVLLNAPPYELLRPPRA